jgi:hypothetical protein
MPALSRPKDGVLSHAYVAGIHVFTTQQSTKKVDGRDKPGHDKLLYPHHLHINWRRLMAAPRTQAGVNTTRPITLPARNWSMTAFTSSSGLVATGTGGTPVRRTSSINSFISGRLPTYEP